MASSVRSVFKERCKHNFSLGKQNSCPRAITAAGHVISEWS